MTKIVGILNITPDSFSDGGNFCDFDAAINHVKKMLDDGADVIDIGAESTRPNAQKLSDAEEWQRLKKILPAIIKEVKKYKGVQTSIDSYHFENIKKSYDEGIDIINDVSALIDEKITQFIAAKNIKTILMHNLAIHANPDLIVNQDLNINDEIIFWAQQKIKNLEKKGVKKSQLIFDPGIGFAKNSRQSIRILKNITSYKILNLPIYVGHSKKSFLDELDIKGNRSEKTLEISKFLIEKGVDFLRVHDVATHKLIL